MARLPTPGSDDGTWGAILNSYLLQSHTSAGDLRDDSVDTAQLADNAVTESKLSSGVQTKLNTVDDPTMGGDLTGLASNAQLGNGVVGTNQIATAAVTTAKLADGSVTLDKLASETGLSDGLRSLLICYAPPNIINGKFDNDYAAGIISRYDDAVLGTGLESSGNAYHASTVAIMTKVATLNPNTVIWGYIDCGVTTGNLSLNTIQSQVDDWLAMGVGGIFCDVIGYAYGVSRSRQNSIINYIHSKGLGAILNVFDPAEVFGSTVNPTYNPSGTPTAATSQDVLLLESWAFNSDAYTDPFYATFSDLKTRGDAARAYRQSLGIRIFASNIIAYTGNTEEDLQDYRGLAESLARIWRLDGSGVAASSYSSTGPDVGLVQPRFTQLHSHRLVQTAPYILNGPWTEVEAPDLGITVHFETGTHTWVQL